MDALPERERPPVSVVVPFHGNEDEARATLRALKRLQLAAGDEIIVADNTSDGVMAGHVAGRVVSVPAGAMRSSYYARNVGAEHAGNDWFVFLDSDCVPVPTLLDDYFTETVDHHAGAVAGEVVAAEGQTALAARYQRSRRHIGQAELREHSHRPMAVTANVMVRRSAWEEVGGFLEGIRSGGDADFSWRIQDAGWTIGYAAGAIVEHRHRETIVALIRQSARYGAGMSWLRRRHADVRFEGRIRALARCAAGVVIWTLTLRFERALFKALDAVWVLANGAGALASNAHYVEQQARPETPAVVVVTAGFPMPAASRIARALERDGHPVRVEAATRVADRHRTATRGLPVSFGEDEGAARRLRDLAWLVATRPLRCLHDRKSRGPDDGGRSLTSLAPCARRIAASADRIVAVPGGTADAARLSRLAGVPLAVGDTPATGPAGTAAQIVPLDSP